jgi:hypothetical protein
MRQTGEAVSMMAQAFARHKHLFKLTTRESVGAHRFGARWLAIFSHSVAGASGSGFDAPGLTVSVVSPR